MPQRPIEDGPRRLRGHGDAAAYAGTTLFKSPGIGAGLSPVGQYFKNSVLGNNIPPMGNPTPTIACP